MADNKVITLQVVVDSKGAIVGMEGFNKELEKATNGNYKLAQSSKSAEAALGKQSRSFNLAGAAVLSFTQGLSDVPFGLRGVANNISQFVTLMAMLTQSTGGVKAAFASFAKALWSPMGVVAGIQVLMAVVQILEQRQQKAARAAKKHAEEQKKLKRAVDKTTVSIQSQSDKLEALIIAFNEGDDKISRAAGESIKQMIPNFDKLIASGLSLNEVVMKFNELLIARSDIKENLKALKDIRKERELIYTGKSNKTILQVNKEELNIRLALIEATKAALQLEDQLINKSEESARKHIEVLNLISQSLKESDVDKMLEEKFIKRLEEINALMDELVAKDFIKGRFPFRNENLRMIDVFSLHIDAVSSSLDSLSSIMGSVNEMIDRESKAIFRIQQGLAIASITMDTFVAAAKVTAATPFLAGLMTAAIYARGAAQVAAVASQKLDGSSNLKGTSTALPTPTEDDSLPVVTTGFSNLRGGENPNSNIYTYVLEHDIRAVGDKVRKTRVRSRL